MPSSNRCGREAYNAIKPRAPSADMGTLTTTIAGTPSLAIASVPDATAADTDTTAAKLTTVNTAIAAANQDLLNLRTQVNLIRTALRAHGLML